MNNIMLIGDAMLDIYVEGQVARLSPEAPVPVISNPSERHVCGGAANVALNLSSLGFNVTFLTNIGKDEAGEILFRKLRGANVEVVSFDDDYKTITKVRYLTQGHQVLRVDTEQKYSVSAAQRLRKFLKENVSDFDAVVLSDYDKGVLNNLPEIISMAKSSDKNVYIDPKVPQISLYRGATCITPNRLEAIQLFGDLNLDDMKKINPSDHGLDYVVITLAAEGALFLSDQDSKHIPAEEIDVVDVTGAGDCFISSLVYSRLKLATSISDAVRNAVKVSSKSVTKKGNYILTPNDHKTDKVVFTNGCFDILHAGHVDYLKRAASLGSKLLVGLNTDESVRGLKGDSRPINTFEHRKLILLSLKFVDAVIGFSEETPENLIRSVKPDVLVKGADYEPEEIVGADFVTSYGGKVITLNFNYETSTSKTVAKCQKIDI